MPRLVVGDLDPVVAEALGHVAAETGDDVPGEVDGVQLDMGERVKQRRPAGDAARLAAGRHVAGRAQFRFRRTGRAVWRGGPADLSNRAASPVLGELAGQADLFGRVRGSEDG